MRNNHPIPSNHFKKTALRYKTFFHEPARLRKRLAIKKKQAKLLYPAPLKRLYPIIRSHTLKHNKKERFGRGFTPEELKEVDLDYRKAKNLRIATDLRRKNFSQECFQQNVNRLKEYLNRIKIFPTKREAKECGIKQCISTIIPITKNKPVIERVLVKNIDSRIWAYDKVKQLMQEEKQHKLALQKQEN